MRPIFLSLESTAEAVSLSQATVQLLVREGSFPKPRLLSGRRVGWLVRELDEWAEVRPVSDQPPPPNTGHTNRRRAAGKT
ncbi:helix-turn-helix transcriptional regulator [Paraburkholderia solisilvae]|uniref:helix-turn-helix transcriptional regulator n=1 Tax=Paraburkholderia solisilvae TaxID=624376 RepID=UPI001582BFC9|nr:AlpA family phage regulatory protein [Paraburkholderia solisilvae]